MVKRVSFISLRVLLGLLFVFSAYAKIDPIEYFEFQLVNDHLANWALSSYFARAIIGFELFLGLCFLTNFDWKKLVVKSAFVMMILMTIYLLITFIFRGNEPNCNCFGNFIKVSTVESIAKNIAILLVLFLVLRFDKGYEYRFPRIILPAAFVIAMSTVYVVNPVNKEFYRSIDEKEVNYKVDLSFLYTDSTFVTPPTDLMKGKHVVAFISLTCPHCRLAALKFGIIKKQDPNIPIYFVLNGDSVNLKPFYEETKAEHIPSNIVLGRRFVFISGFSLPNIMFLNNGIVERKVSYHEITKETIEDWLSKK